MNQNYSDVRATAQTKLNREYADGATPVPEGRIREVVEETIVFLGASDVDTRALVAELEAIFKTIIGSERALVGYDDGWSPWLAKRRADIPWRFWDRYRHYLQRGQGWPLATVERLDQATDRVLDYLTNPVAPGAWDRRGMVVGHVQSGKTANYVGLVCKAADAGYKIIIVLAGFHKSLRSQTQIRLEEGFLGYDRGATLQDPSGRRATVGVGDTHLYDPAPAADSITTRADDGDFKRALAKNFAIHPGGNPLLFVVKKNASVLRNLLEWVRWVAQSKDEKGRKYIKGVPLIVIDDEADQGSIDTRKGAFDEEGNVDEDHDPTVLNARIRELLYLFDQSAYIGYTATPFANILIHEQGRTDGQGDDLFPRSFIISLPTASNYVGPSRIFGFSGPDQEPVEPLPIVREVSDHAASLALREDSGWIPPRHNKDWIPKHDGLARVPPSLQRAIRSFVLACAARLARRDASAHNTMLVHVTRFTAVQHRVAEQVNEELLDIQRRLRYGDGDSSITIRSALRTLWEEDFEPTHATIRGMGLGLDCLEHPWTELEPLVERAALSIVVREINGAAGEVLDYISHRENGLNVIAIGGDKLSRGLTLEGLSVSYFLRASRMYDTLMQMGRWFGYRPRFLDLCRLYTTAEMVDWFSHIAAASEELREDFNRMATSGGTPRDFGHRVQSHSLMVVTSAVKMRSGTVIDVTFAGGINETINFWRTRSRLEQNLAAARALVEAAEDRGAIPARPPRRTLATGVAKDAGPWLWSDVSADLIVAFLESYREHDASKKVKTRLLADYVEAERAQGRLTRWTVFLASGDAKKSTNFGSVQVNFVKRAWHASVDEQTALRQSNHFRIRRLLSPSDEAVDLSEESWADAMKDTLEAWKVEPESGAVPSRPAGPQIRQRREPSRGLLLIYPIHAGTDTDAMVEPDARHLPIIGFGISFPHVSAAHATKVRYVVNNVYWQQELNFQGEPEGDDT